MQILPIQRLAAPALLIALIATAASAQRDDGRAQDTSRVNNSGPTADTVSGHNWLMSLMRKIARRSDDDSTSTEAGGSEVVATPAATGAHNFKSRKDSLSWESARGIAERSQGFRVVVNIFDKQLYVIDGNDTLRRAPVATAMNATLEYGKQVWHFETPRGVRTVLRKDREPVWNPPEWHFAEVALEHGLKLRQLERGRVVKLEDGTKLLTQGDEVGIIRPGETEFTPMVLDEHVVFDNTLFIPPAGTKHRQIQGELGHFRLDLGDGYMLHGTPYQKSIGAAVTHGCVRMHDEDIGEVVVRQRAAGNEGLSLPTSTDPTSYDTPFGVRRRQRPWPDRRIGPGFRKHHPTSRSEIRHPYSAADFAVPGSARGPSTTAWPTPGILVKANAAGRMLL